MLLRLQGIQKRFGGVVALAGANLEVQAGRVHLLLGENGAGKSTLMKIVAGMQSQDGGSILWKGQPFTFRRPADAATAGIAMVHQESLLAPHPTVSENIWLGHEFTNGRVLVDRRAAVKATADLIEAHRFPLRPDWRVERLSPAQRQLVEICRAVAQGSSLLIFDEPTSALSEAESNEVFRIVRGLRDQGIAVIYITHRLQELRELGQDVTVLRDGLTVHTGQLQATSTEELIHHMVGRQVPALYARKAVPPGEPLLKVHGLSDRRLLKDVSFTLRAGEIVGLAGLIGAGRTELCRALFGVDPIDAGSIEIAGRPVRIRTPQDAVTAGLALIPEDRQIHGLARGLSVGQNMMLPSLRNTSTLGFLNSTKQRGIVAEQISRLQVKADSASQPVVRLSGGNQQKVVIAKWIASGARIYLFDEPTRGIDIGAKVEVFRVMDDLANQGAAILMVSSELPELLQVADRILVMRQGRITADLPSGTSQQEILRYAALDTTAT